MTVVGDGIRYAARNWDAIGEGIRVVTGGLIDEEGGR